MFTEDTSSCVRLFDCVMTESHKDKDQELDETKAMLEKVREENEKLKLILSTIFTDYKSLQGHVSNVLRHQHETPMELDKTSLDDFGVDISLRLGRSEPNTSKKDQEIDKNISPDKIGSSLGLEFRTQSCDEDHMETANNEAVKLDNVSRGVKNVISENKNVPSKKDLKSARRENQGEVLETHGKGGLKKTRVCVKATCEDPSINDGCQWRKYGQKTAKTNPLPRSYYRCSMSSNCPVRKQVQRCGEEETAAYLSTYEGTHDHPVPPEASHIAAGTSAAASLLNSGSSSSSATLNHFFPFHHYSVSTTNSHPTVTLDLTQPSYLNQLQNYPLSSSSLSFSSSSDRPSPSNSHTLNFGLRSQGPLSTYTQMACLSNHTRVSGQQ